MPLRPWGSQGDVPMLNLASRSYFVGERLPSELSHAKHWRDASIEAIVSDMLAWFTHGTSSSGLIAVVAHWLCRCPSNVLGGRILGSHERFRFSGRASRDCLRLRIRSRIASCSSSGVQNWVNSPARHSRSRISASRRSVLNRSPVRRGIMAGETTA